MVTKTKKTKTTQTQGQQHLIPTRNPHTLPPQDILDLFKHTFRSELYGDNDQAQTTTTATNITSSSQTNTLETLTAQIQEVKTHLYNRDYIEAFGTNTRRTAYCIRWSPSRAICYSALFAYFDEIVNKFTPSAEDGSTNIMCVGGGAGAELVAFASLFTIYTVSNSSRYRKIDSKDSEGLRSLPLNLHLKLVDIADWSSVVDKLGSEIRERWLKNNNNSNGNNLEDSGFSVDFLHGDILRVSESAELDLQNLDLITMLFTTNELFQEDKVGGVKFLQRLNKHCSAGCLLLIVESAGSYSHITIGSKKFPVQFLIDTILCGKRGSGEEEETGAWELLKSDDSTWYRYDKDLDYPIQLENMRFFYRLYRKREVKKDIQL